MYNFGTKLFYFSKNHMKYCMKKANQPNTYEYLFGNLANVINGNKELYESSI